MGTGAPQIEVDEQGRLMFQIGQGACQVLLPVQLNATQANSIDISAIFGATLAAQPGASDGALAFTLGDQTWRFGSAVGVVGQQCSADRAVAHGHRWAAVSQADQDRTITCDERRLSVS